eukprot:c12078_g1_i1 orf=152-388(+)
MATPVGTASLTKTYHIEKLNGANYLPWSLRISMLLEKDENLGVVNEIEAQPAAPPEAIAEWRRKDLAARTEIILHLGD